jgi:D-alanine-D-alanine ligase
MKTRVAILCGGLSGEHQVSLISAFNIARALPTDHYEFQLIGIRKDGSWCWRPEGDLLCQTQDIREIHLHPAAETLLPRQLGRLQNEQGKLQWQADIFLPITHGNFGEDGSLQGMLRLLRVPFVGCDVWGSAISMDKDITKRLLVQAGLPVTPFITLRRNETLLYSEAVARLGSPFFVKPTREGSSLGVAKVRKEDEYPQALKEAFSLDHKILLEQAIIGREIEAAVLGNDAPEVAEILGEIIPNHEFYSYDAKYVDPNGAILKIPAEIEASVASRIRDLAVESFRVVEGLGMARVDFFLTKDNQIYINEINTLPGFTSISMYPKLWEASGLSYSELLHQLVQLGLQRAAV